MKANIYTVAEISNNATKRELITRNTHNVNGYSLLLIRRQYRKDGGYFQQVSITQDREMVELYYQGTGGGLRIRTTSCGALNIDYMKKEMAAAYQNAIDTIEWFNQFDWESADIIEDYV